MSSEVLIVCITYGHPAAMVRDALASGRILAARGQPVRLVVLDDSSGNKPEIGTEDIEVHSTSRQGGYAAAANHAVRALAQNAERVVFVNPDAQVPIKTMQQLCWPTGEEEIIVPSIAGDDERLENVRSVLRPRDALLQLILPRLGQQELLRAPAEDCELTLGRPWVPSGAVLSCRTDSLRTRPFRDEMFWVEMSAWARDSWDTHSSFLILKDRALHLGGSSKSHAGLAVRASELNARMSYVKEYGSPFEKRLVAPSAAIGVASAVLTRRLALRDARQLCRIVAGRKSWEEVL